MRGGRIARCRAELCARLSRKFIPLQDSSVGDMRSVMALSLAAVVHGHAHSTELRLVSRFYAPYGDGESFAFGMGAGEKAAYDPVQKIAYTASEQAAPHILPSSYSRPPPPTPPPPPPHAGLPQCRQLRKPERAAPPQGPRTGLRPVANRRLDLRRASGRRYARGRQDGARSPFVSLPLP